MKNRPRKKIGKEFRVNVGMPDHLNRVKVTSITYTKQGIIGNMECPECEGDGHSLEDNTNASGGTVNPSLCGFCDGKGNIDEDMVEEIKFDHEGEPVIVFKTGDERYNM